MNEDENFLMQIVLRLKKGEVEEEFIEFLKGELKDKEYAIGSQDIILDVIDEEIKLPINTLSTGHLSEAADFIKEHATGLNDLICLCQSSEFRILRQYGGLTKGFNANPFEFGKKISTIRKRIENCYRLGDEVEYANMVAYQAEVEIKRIKAQVAAKEGNSASSDKRKRKPLGVTAFKKIGSRDGYKCTYCLSEKNLEVDHIIPFSEGGSDNLDNLQLLCEDCNREKGTSRNSREVKKKIQDKLASKMSAKTKANKNYENSVEHVEDRRRHHQLGAVYFNENEDMKKAISILDDLLEND